MVHWFSSYSGSLESSDLESKVPWITHTHTTASRGRFPALPTDWDAGPEVRFFLPTLAGAGGGGDRERDLPGGEVSSGCS